MHVYAWRQGPVHVVRHPKRPSAPWTAAELGELPTLKDAGRRIFYKLMDNEGPKQGPTRLVIGTCTDLSPDIGVYQNGMAEVSRRTDGDRVEITWLRGFWESLHVIYAGKAVGDARDLARELLGEGRKRARELWPNKIFDMASAGRGMTAAPPFFVYVVIQVGGVSVGTDKVAFGPRDRSRARNAEAGKIRAPEAQAHSEGHG